MKLRIALAVVTLAAVVGLAPVVTAPAGTPSLPLAAPPAEAAAARTAGDGPLADVLFWADQKKACGLSRDELAAMMLVPTFPESGAPTNRAPSPMTLSRWDTQSTLYAFSTPGLANKAFFHPGVGMWQFDSAGGWQLTAATAISTWTSAAQAATVMSQRWCASTQTDPVKRRAYAMGPWFECSSGTLCEGIYQSILVSGVLTVDSDASVLREGGMEVRTCQVANIGQVSCGYVDPAKAQGYNAFAAPNAGPTPITAPFYVFDAGGREYRYWLDVDTGYAQTIVADKPITANARTSLVWHYRDDLCDVTANRGNCGTTHVPPSWSGVFSFGGSSSAGVGTGLNKDGRQEIFRVGTDGQVWHAWQTSPNGLWSDWYTMGGAFPPSSTPTAGRNADGRLELFVRGSDRALWHAYQMAPNAGWTDWSSMNGDLTDDATVGFNADGHMELFARRPTGQMYHTFQLAPNAGWSQWFEFGGNFFPGAKLAAVTNLDGRLEVFGIASDGGLWHAWQLTPNGFYSGFDPMGGTWPTDKVADTTRNADGRLEAFVVGSDHQLWHAWQVAPGKPWSNWSALPGTWGSSPRVVRDQSGRLNLAALGTDGQLGVQSQMAAGTGWAPVSWLGGSGTVRPEFGFNADGHLELYFVANDSAIYHAWQLSVPS